jgi:hypothetical protein
VELGFSGFIEKPLRKWWEYKGQYKDSMLVGFCPSLAPAKLLAIDVYKGDILLPHAVLGKHVLRTSARSGERASD